MRVAVDASVVVKWAIPDPMQEPDADRAVALLEGIRRGEVAAIQPPHWLVEVAAVVARLRPAIADRVVRLLDAMELPTDGTIDTLARAVELSESLDHHLFDTLYHATALRNEATLVTADEHYLRKARLLGSLVHLRDWAMQGHG